MPLDWNKPLQTKEGEQARLLGIVNSSSPRLTHIVAVKDAVDGTEYVFSYNKSGECFEDGEHTTELDLVNTPQKHVLWLNCYSGTGGTVRHADWHDSREDADHWGAASCNRRIACIKVEFEEGEGLSNGG